MGKDVGGKIKTKAKIKTKVKIEIKVKAKVETEFYIGVVISDCNINYLLPNKFWKTIKIHRSGDRMITVLKSQTLDNDTTSFEDSFDKG